MALSRGAVGLTAAVALAAGAAAAAQETWTNGTSIGGRASASSARIAAQDLADSLALACRVTEVAFLGRSESGDPQYEIACADGPGYRLMGGPDGEAIDCLALATLGRSVACRLPANRDGTARIAAIAREAGLACRVDEGVMIGLTPDRRPIYEAGCDGTAGAWIEQTERGWRVTDCLATAARGQACRFTSESESLAAFHGWLAAGPALGCDPAHIRYMGEGAGGPLYEAKCRSGEGVVVRFSRERTVEAVIPCAAAAHIGDGCLLTSAPRP